MIVNLNVSSAVANTLAARRSEVNLILSLGKILSGTAAQNLRYRTAMNQNDDGRLLVEAVREAARRHNSSWEALVPDPFTVNFLHEAAEEAAYAEMAQAKAALRDHICETYGISLKELSSLASL